MKPKSTRKSTSRPNASAAKLDAVFATQVALDVMRLPNDGTMGDLRAKALDVIERALEHGA